MARIFQPSRGRSGKQDRNQFTKLGAHFLAHPFMNNPPHTFSLHISQTMLFLPTLCPSHLTAELSNGEKLGGNCLSPLSSFLSYSPLRLSLVRRPSVRPSVRPSRPLIHIQRPNRHLRRRFSFQINVERGSSERARAWNKE